MFRKLCDRNGTPAVSLVPDHLRRDGVLDDGEIPDHQELYVSRVDEGAYLVQVVDPEQGVPDLDDSRREAPQRAQ